MERERDKKREQEDKRRCAYFLLQMIEKYGAIVWEKHMEE